MRKDKNLLLTLGMLCISMSMFSQVGINTQNPQGVFHVDGGKDNPTIGSPDAIQQSNDFIVTASGNVGVGTTTPARKLEIVSSTSPSLRIVDGTQQANYVLMSDATGNGSWKSLTTSITGTLPSTGYNAAFSSTYNYTGISLTLPPGKWMVLTNILLKGDADPAPGSGAWVRLSWSNNQTTGNLTGITGPLNSGVYAVRYGSAVGSSIINNSTTGNATYYLLVSAETFGGYTGNWDNLGSSSWTENSILAYPAN